MKVRLENVPARLYVEHIDHFDGLANELRVVGSGETTGFAPVASSVATLVHDVLARYEGIKNDTYLDARDAIELGQETVTLEMELPVEAAGHLADLLAALERADELCRAGDLLTLPASPAVTELRRWAVAELARQLTGAAAGGPSPEGGA